MKKPDPTSLKRRRDINETGRAVVFKELELNALRYTVDFFMAFDKLTTLISSAAVEDMLELHSRIRMCHDPCQGLREFRLVLCTRNCTSTETCSLPP